MNGNEVFEQRISTLACHGQSNVDPETELAVIQVVKLQLHVREG